MPVRPTVLFADACHPQKDIPRRSCRVRCATRSTYAYHVIIRSLDPRFLSSLASYDLASIVRQALYAERGSPVAEALGNCGC